MVSGAAGSHVHLASPGADVLRVVSPLKLFGCSRLHLILQAGNDPLYDDIADEVERQAREFLPELEVRRTPVQLFDGPRVFNAIGRLISEEVALGSQVFVNVATGSNLYTACAMMACLMYGGTPYHSQTLEYWSEPSVLRDRGRPRGITKRAAPAEVVPLHGPKAPDPRHIFALDLIQRVGGATKAQRLGRGLVRAGVLPGARAASDGSAGKAARKREADRQLQATTRKFVDPLLKEGWLAKEGSRGGARLTVTPDGQRALATFRGIRYDPAWRLP